MSAETVSTETLHTATEWWLRLREPNVSPATIAEWMKWCEASPAHEDAFERVQEVWQMAGRAPLEAVPSEQLTSEPAEQRGGTALPWAAAIAGVGLLAGIIWTTASWNSRADVEVATPIGYNRELKLPDGSLVTLGGSSALSTEFSKKGRMVRLDRGEAFFKVKADKNRPFVVRTSTIEVIAVGTAFNVRADDNTARVTVTEGVVDIASGYQRDNGVHQSTERVRVRAGQQLTLRGDALAATSGAKAEVNAVDPAMATAWTGGSLKFIDEPLDSVVAAVNRYSPTAIELSGANLAGMRYTGTVVCDRIDEWLMALPNSFPLDVARQGSGPIVLRTRHP